ncbi:prephenate dehydratase [Thiomicrorhabdus indica]|uniref:prephenate dehydratase n=1 Tax=Thiomicrorhabdus indica TaxID=2267253 RepID=UPI00102D97C4|nr:prephenate dehydratase [Thiomicrorhabdus indica]
MSETVSVPNPEEAQQLLEIRNQIDSIDRQIQELLGKRAQCAQKVADIKTQGGTVEAVFYRPEREAQVLRAVKERNQSLLPDETMAKLFREIMSACLALEQPVTVAYLGPEGSYTHASVIKQFGSYAHPHAVSTIEEVFESVERGETQYGIVPLENSTEGAVKQTQNKLIETSLTVSGEVELAIDHCLLSKAISTDQVKIVRAHPQALGQCENWLRNNLPWAQLEEVDSNAAAAVMAQNDSTVAAIASEQAARIYDLTVLESHISDQKGNSTKFWLLGKEKVEPSGDDKTALLVSIKNESGALLNLLESFYSRAINMTRIVSRPSNNKQWDYMFFIDVQGHQDEEPLKTALAEAKKLCDFYKVLGSFPVSPL